MKYLHVDLQDSAGMYILATVIGIGCGTYGMINTLASHIYTGK